MKFGKFRGIAHFMYMDHKNKMMYVDNMGSHPIESFMDFFKYTFYAWLQLFREDQK